MKVYNGNYDQYDADSKESKCNERYKTICPHIGKVYNEI